jgi:thiol:disulfide interchange protein DsbC
MRGVIVLTIALAIASASITWSSTGDGPPDVFKESGFTITGASVSGAVAAEDQVSARLKAAFPKLEIDEVTSSPINGIFTVFAGGNVLYFSPSSGHMIFGEIWDEKGKNLTAELRPKIAAYKQKKTAAAYKEIEKQLDQAVKIGTGKKIVVEFTDPDCPFCRQAGEYWKTRDDVTRYVFFMPLPMHPNAPAKAKYILGAADQAAAMGAVYGGKFDANPVPTTGKNVDKQLELHRGLATKAGINGTPAYYIGGVFVSGADVGAFEKIIGKKGESL